MNHVESGGSGGVDDELCADPAFSTVQRAYPCSESLRATCASRNNRPNPIGCVILLLIQCENGTHCSRRQLCCTAAMIYANCKSLRPIHSAVSSSTSIASTIGLSHSVSMSGVPVIVTSRLGKSEGN